MQFGFARQKAMKTPGGAKEKAKGDVIVALPEDTLLTKAGLAAFLASPYVRGVGKVYAGRLADAFGYDLIAPGFDFSIVPEQISGISESKCTDIEASLERLRFAPEIACLLYSSGLSDTEVGKILSHYGHKAAKALLEDPYDMVENVWKTSFFTADKLGRHLGFAADDPRRIRGALLTAVKFYAEKGNMFATREQALQTASHLTGATVEKVIPELEHLIKEERLIESRNGIYLPVYYHAEKETAQKLTSLIRRGEGNLGKFEVPSTDIAGNPLNKEQKEAILTVMTHPVTVITGGPGTGKTTAVRGIISLFEEMGKSVILAAPTGRAAKRLSVLAGAQASTIHRLLGYNMGRGYRIKKLEADILVIDEASMLEQVLFNHLLDAVGPHTKIVLVGDTNQLPSIGAGDVLNDLIASGTVPVVRLTENFRQKAGSAIAATAEDVRAGIGVGKRQAGDFVVFTEENPEKIHAKILALVGKEIPEEYGIDAKDIQVVTPQQEGPLGSKQLNLDIQERVNPTGPELKRGLKRFRLSDRVMQTSNSSLHDIYNGETGWVSDVDEAGDTLWVTFHDGKVSEYGRDRLGELNLAYAVTVHKLQGSETDYMVMVLTSAHRQMLYRNLLYTGISRAKKLCVLVGEEKAIEAALSNETAAVRNSNFRHRLRAYLPSA